MAIEVPAELKSTIPLTWFGRVLAATPVVMAVVATMLAGLSSSEMTRAQYDRSLAAQQQSKAGDQWSFFQAKRLRGAFQSNTAELLQSLSEVHPFDPAALRRATEGHDDLVKLLDSPAAAEALGCLQRGAVPPAPAAPATDPRVKAALDAKERLKPDSAMAALLAPITPDTLNAALRAAQDQADAFDSATKPINTVIDQLGALLPGLTADVAGSGGMTDRPVIRDFIAARLRYTAARYEVEARLNQSIANTYELQVRKSNLTAERHHARSEKFFYGMLGAQLGVIVSTFAVAARRRSLLWSLAAAAGLVAITFAGYVYLFI